MKHRASRLPVWMAGILYQCQILVALRKHPLNAERKKIGEGP